ncbi:L-glutaminase [Pacificibacter maritimus]|uniref:Glutaminase n=1 Tax=Pacificibacter maritimus TaxID=762213 RepID=A0A3N4VDL6_9RHOB|nr:glutaminase [Pacificibacter maritimus]RPE71950.1 L-glutaminase [Pacificibacter maritimus]
MQAILDRIAKTIGASTERGQVATYIPDLAQVDPNQFGIAVCLANGQEYFAGDARTPFSIQSVSKVFAVALALGKVGDGLWRYVGREPSGLAFDSIMLLERERGIPRNPFINAGAIVTTDTYLAGSTPAEALGGLLRFVRDAAEDNDIHINDAVARGEMDTADRNFALAHYMKSHGNLSQDAQHTMGTYCHQCAIDMSCLQLARAGRFLMGGAAGPRLVTPERARRIQALMMTCGHYDGSGDFAFRVGLPGKSGVGGGILVINPGVASIAVWSPGLNAYGNSKLGTEAMEALAQELDWSVFS